MPPGIFLKLLYVTFFFVTDSEVSKIFTQISVTKSEAYINLDESDFFEKTLINKRKKWILEGLDPDEEEQKLLKKKKKTKRKLISKKGKSLAEKNTAS